MTLAPIPTILAVDRERFTLTVWHRPKTTNRFRMVRRYPIAVGMVGLETPQGHYLIVTRSDKPEWRAPDSEWVDPEIRGKLFAADDPANPIKARWLGIYDGAGIHGIDPREYDTLGSAASHGCIRMRIPDVIELYPRVPKFTPIHIH